MLAINPPFDTALLYCIYSQSKWYCGKQLNHSDMKAAKPECHYSILCSVVHSMCVCLKSLPFRYHMNISKWYQRITIFIVRPVSVRNSCNSYRYNLRVGLTSEKESKLGLAYTTARGDDTCVLLYTTINWSVCLSPKKCPTITS